MVLGRLSGLLDVGTLRNERKVGKVVMRTRKEKNWGREAERVRFES